MPLTALLIVLTTHAGAPPARPALYDTICTVCHAVGGTGGQIGPALDGVANRKTPQELDLWLADPQKVKPGTAMPKVDMTDAQRAEMVRWLSSLK